MVLLDICTHGKQTFNAKDFNKQQGYSFIIDLEDNKDKNRYVETGVYLHWNNNEIFGIAVDISCMCGCNLSCKFCSSSGYNNGELSKEQMVAQVELSLNYIKACEEDFYSKCELITFSFAGMGEPSKCGNRGDEIIEAMKILKKKYAKSFRTIHFIISTTAAESRAIILWADCKEIELHSLQISLHAPTDEKRKKLIGSKKIDNISDIFNSLAYFNKKSLNTEIKINYLLIAEENDTSEDFNKLMKLIEGTPYWLKLSLLNETGVKLKSPNASAYERFFNRCVKKHKDTYKYGVPQSTPLNISCGQLAAYANKSSKKVLNNESIKNIYEQIIDGDVILFLGAGVNSTFKKSIDLANELFDKLFKNDEELIMLYKDARNNLAEVADFYSVEKKGPMHDHIKTALEQTKHPKEFLELTKHQWKTIYTTNYDMFVENAYVEAFENKLTDHKCVPIIDPKQLADKILKNAVLLVKLHGGNTQNYSQNVISSIDYLDNYESKRQYFFKMLESDFLRHTFVFAGYSFKDHYLSQLLYNVHNAYSESEKKSYAILPWDDKKGLYKKILKMKYGIELINCTFEDFLNELARLRKSLKVFVSGSTNAKKRIDLSDMIIGFCKILGEKFKNDGIYLITGATATDKVGYLVANIMEEKKVKTYGWQGAENSAGNEIRKMISYEECGGQSTDVIDKVIRECNVAIFVGGASVCLEEIMQAMSKGKLIIPIKIGDRDYASDVIHEYICGNLDVLERFEGDVIEVPENRSHRFFNKYLNHDIINKLILKGDNAEEVAETVMNILRRFRMDNSLETNPQP